MINNVVFRKILSRLYNTKDKYFTLEEISQYYNIKTSSILGVILIEKYKEFPAFEIVKNGNTYTLKSNDVGNYIFNKFLSDVKNQKEKQELCKISGVDRQVPQGNLDEALLKLNFCLNHLEKSEYFKKGIHWNTSITERLTLEEMIGALVNAEQILKKIKEEMEYESSLTP